MRSRITVTVSLPGVGWRVRWILVAFALGWAITLGVGIAARAELFSTGNHTLAEVFVAWAGELIFFTLVGLAVTVVSLEKPATPPDPRTRPLRERIGILFGMSEVPDVMIEYSRKVLEGLARYVRHSRRMITVQAYEPALAAYRVEVEHEYTIQNVLDSAQNEHIPLRIAPDRFPEQPNLAPGRVMSIRIDGDEKITRPTPIGPEGFETEFEVSLPPSGACVVTTTYEILMRCGCAQSLTARRLVKDYKLEFVSRVDSNPVIVLQGGQKRQLTLLFNQPTPDLGGFNHEPGEKLHDFMFRTPTLAPPAGPVASSPPAEDDLDRPVAPPTSTGEIFRS